MLSQYVLNSLLWIRIRIRIWIQQIKGIQIQSFDDQNQKLKGKKQLKFFCYIFCSKVAIYLSLGLHTWRPSPLFLWVIFALLDQDLLNPDPIRIRIHNNGTHTCRCLLNRGLAVSSKTIPTVGSEMVVLRIRIQDPVIFWPLDPGSVYRMGKIWIRIRDWDTGWTMNIPDHFSESLETVFWVKNT